MKIKTHVVLGLAVLSTFTTFYVAQLSTAFAQGTAFTYQGRLNDGASAANGVYDLAFALFDGPSGGGLIGNTITNNAVGVTNGLFTVTLDFGNQFDGSARWLVI